MVALAPDMAEQMHWFDCGTAPEGLPVNLDSVNDNPLPYDQCAADAVLFIKGRPHFHHPSGERAAFNSGAPICLIAYGKHNADVLRASGLGHVVNSKDPS